jgi:hypothetical protein
MSAVSLRRIRSQVSLEEGNYDIAEFARHQIGGYEGPRFA